MDITDLIIDIIMLTVAITISFFIIYTIWLMAIGMCKVAKHEDELIEKEIENMKERNKNDKGN